ncbi:unnamed protein product [Meloidogyne enterolobii]|uniref:Uncharacterized protein n=1 Tax=Meloidogyne enterolobii TaxID=390850 RepID=A0ACB1APW2_MELEN
MLQCGVLRRICLLINEHCNLDLPPPSSPIFDSSKQHQRHSVDVSGIENNLNLIDKNQQKVKTEEIEEERESRKKFIIGGNKAGKTGSRRSSTQQAKGALKDVKQPPRKRPGSAEPNKLRGIGYGRGSTKSKWNMERTVEERAIQEEHLIWLLSALIAYLWGDRLLERVCDWEMSLGYKGGERRRSVPSMFYGEMPAHLEEEILAEQILQSAVIPLLAHHLSNDSVLFELTAGLAGIPAILPHLVKQEEKSNGKSIAKELIPQFRDNMNNYPMLVRGITEADISFMDFIRKVNDFSEVILRMSRQYEKQLPTEKRVKTSCAPRHFLRVKNGQQNAAAFQRRRRSLFPSNLTTNTTIERNSNSFANIAELGKLNNDNSEESSPSSPLHKTASHTGLSEGVGKNGGGGGGGDFHSARLKSSRGIRPMTRHMDREEIARIDAQSPLQQYKELLRELQMSTWKLINDAGKPVYGFSFKKELRSVNPFSPTHKDRTKRIAK